MSVSRIYFFPLELIKSFPCSFNPLLPVNTFFFSLFSWCLIYFSYARYILSLSHSQRAEQEENVRLQNLNDMDDQVMS